ncbi:hypothetical protein L522_2636, partial [Bordetella bronchiseptica MBORD707]
PAARADVAAEAVSARRPARRPATTEPAPSRRRPPADDDWESF